jgi:hypothetical protein
MCLSMRDIFRLERVRTKQILPLVSSNFKISYPTDTKP